MNTFDRSDLLNNSEIIRIANYQAHEVAASDAKFGGDYVTTFTTVFNFLFRKLLMPETGKTPGWVVRLANYFTFDSEIDEILESSSKSGDPLNQAEYVILTVRFKRNGSGPVVEVKKETLPLEPTKASN